MEMNYMTSDDLIEVLKVLHQEHVPAIFQDSFIIFKNNMHLNRLDNMIHENKVPRTQIILNLLDKLKENANHNLIFSVMKLSATPSVKAVNYCIPLQFICNHHTFDALFHDGYLTEVSFSDKTGLLDVKKILRNENERDVRYSMREILELVSVLNSDTQLLAIDNHHKAHGVSVLAEVVSLDVPHSLYTRITRHLQHISNKKGSPVGYFTFTQFLEVAGSEISKKYELPREHINELLFAWNKTPNYDNLYNFINASQPMEEWIHTYEVLVKGDDAHEMLRSLNKWVGVHQQKIVFNSTGIKDPRFTKMKHEIEKLGEHIDADTFVDIVTAGIQSINGRGIPKTKGELAKLLSEMAIRVGAVLISKKSHREPIAISPDINS